ncbi:hypothetical protein QPK87_05375 [Kamptonema cortianum]|nr:hypothetical protein [Geitlerinema splendidum]MDK3156008.1 hypothetical protein [Kamptonema cortianum]
MSEKKVTKRHKKADVEAAMSFISNEVAEQKKALANTQIYGSMFVFGLMCFLFSISGGFASNLQPKEAAKITKGLVAERMQEAQPQISEYLRQEIPAWIESAPEYAKSQLPVYRANVENALEVELEKLASNTSSQLDEALTAFLLQNEDQFKTIILAGQDKETTDEVARNMREMFLAYLTEPHGEDESIQTKLDKALIALKEIETKTSRLAHASDLDPTELKTRRAIACLFKTIDENKEAWNLPQADKVRNQLTAGLEVANAALPKN